MKHKILIASYYFYPENTPRAFRTTELVKELLDRNYEIDLIVPYGSLIPDEVTSKNLKIKFVKSYKDIQIKINNNNAIGKKSNFYDRMLLIYMRIIMKIINYFIHDLKQFFFSNNLYKELLKKSSNKYDIVLSIGLPFYVHLGVARYLKKYKINPIKIAEYGDPFYYNTAFKLPFYFKWIEKWTLKKFDYVVVPTQKAIKSFNEFKKLNKIVVIPQGFKIDNIAIKEYKKNSIATFVYAGNFYTSIRNPKIIFDYLSELEIDFEFHIYTKSNNLVESIIKNYPNEVKSKFVLKDFMDRLDLIYEISSADFVLNISNSSDNQVPSKIIDYALTKRPILSLDSNGSNLNFLTEFLNGDYSNQENVNICEYDIKLVVDKYESLFRSK